MANLLILQDKLEHIDEQIETLKTNHADIIGKYKSDLLDPPDEIKFQMWRKDVVQHLIDTNPSNEEIQAQIDDIPHIPTMRNRALSDILLLALEG